MFAYVRSKNSSVANAFHVIWRTENPAFISGLPCAIRVFHPFLTHYQNITVGQELVPQVARNEWRSALFTEAFSEIEMNMNLDLDATLAVSLSGNCLRGQLVCRYACDAVYWLYRKLLKLHTEVNAMLTPCFVSGVRGVLLVGLSCLLSTGPLAIRAEADSSLRRDVVRHKASAALTRRKAGNLGPTSSAEKTIKAFRTAVLDKDAKSFLRFISKRRGLVMRNTNASPGDDVSATLKFSYWQVVKNISRKGWHGEYYDRHFFLEDNSPDDQADTLVWNMKQVKGNLWKNSGQNVFLPATPFERDAPKSFQIKLFNENGKWYVGEIGTPRL